MVRPHITILRSFSVKKGDAAYIGSIVNEWHPPKNFNSLKLVSKKEFGERVPLTVRYLTFSGDLPSKIRGPFRNAYIADDYSNFIPEFKNNYPEFRDLEIKKLLAR